MTIAEINILQYFQKVFFLLVNMITCDYFSQQVFQKCSKELWNNILCQLILIKFKAFFKFHSSMGKLCLSNLQGKSRPYDYFLRNSKILYNRYFVNLVTILNNEQILVRILESNKEKEKKNFSFINLNLFTSTNNK